MWIRLSIVALAISGCAQTYSPQVDAFATTFAAANKNFSETIERVEEQIAARERTIWATDGTGLIDTDECLGLIGPLGQQIDPALCTIEPADAKIQRLGTLESNNLAALAKQLDQYASALQRLAADTTEERAGFEKAVVDAFGSVGKFDSLIAQLEPNAPAFGPFASQLGAGLGKALSLISERQRFAALRRTVNDADAVIQSATMRLDDANVTLANIDLNLAYRPVAGALKKANVSLGQSSASIKDREAAILALQNEVAAYRSIATVSRSFNFAAAARAHGALRQAIAERRDINPETILAFATAISEITEIAEALPDTLPEN